MESGPEWMLSLLAGRLPTFALSMLQIAAAVGLFAWRLERREELAWRAAAAIGVFVCGMAAFLGINSLLAAEVLANGSAAGLALASQTALFALIVAYFTWLVTFLFEAGPWTALFCCTAGYAVQNFASGLLELLWVMRVGTGVELTAELDISRMLPNVLCSLAVYVPFYLLIVRKISRKGLEEIHEPALIAIMATVVFGIIGFDLVIKSLTSTGAVTTLEVVCLRFAHGIMCGLTYALEYELLVSRHLREEAVATARVHAERERQYEASRQNIEAINIKCHDLRHQIRALAAGGAVVGGDALDDLAREVDVYDSSVRTGNDALDTILTEKRLVCARESITLSCVADGRALAFMSSADIYALFGNALDNAIEAVRKIDDATGRSISVVVRQAAGVASIHVENRFAPGAAPRVAPDGALVTSKANAGDHGFGVRSMRLTVERYGGTLATLVQGDTFHVNAMIPLP